MEAMDTGKQLEVVLITKDQDYAIPNSPVMIPSVSTCENLDEIVKTILKSQNDELELDLIEFDFLISDKLIRVTIEEFCQQENVEIEKEIQIEYFVKSLPPEPHKSFLHDDWVSSVDTLNEHILSGCYDGSVHIWNVQTGKHLLSFTAHQSPIKAVQWLRGNDNSLFLTCSHDETASIWQWSIKDKKPEQKSIFIGHVRSVDCCDEQAEFIATGSYDRMLKIWSLNSEKSPQEDAKGKLQSPVMTLEGHKEAITGCTFMKSTESEAVIATCSLDNTIKIWDIEIREQKQILNSNKAFLDIANSSQNGLLLTASCDRHVRCWDPRVREGVQVKSVFTSHTNWISSVAWSEDNGNLFITGGYDNAVKQWDLRSTAAPLFDMLGHQDKVLDVNWTNSQFMISGSADRQIKIFSCKK